MSHGKNLDTLMTSEIIIIIKLLEGIQIRKKNGILIIYCYYYQVFNMVIYNSHVSTSICKHMSLELLLTLELVKIYLNLMYFCII